MVKESYCLDLLAALLAAPVEITKTVKRNSARYTLNGVEAIVEYRGQFYEVSIKPCQPV